MPVPPATNCMATDKPPHTAGILCPLHVVECMRGDPHSTAHGCGPTGMVTSLLTIAINSVTGMKQLLVHCKVPLHLGGNEISVGLCRGLQP